MYEFIQVIIYGTGKVHRLFASIYSLLIDIPSVDTKVDAFYNEVHRVNNVVHVLALKKEL